MTNQESTSTEKRNQSTQDDMEMIKPSKFWLLVPFVLIAGAIFLAR